MALRHMTELFLLSSAAMLPVLVLLLLAARFRGRRPAAARRLLGASVSILVLALSLLGAEAWLRFLYEEPMNLGPWTSLRWYAQNEGLTRGFRGGSATPWESGRLRPVEVEVLVLGDSIAWGQGVGPEQTFPSLLREELDLPVLPAARQGWSTADQLEWLLAHPDLRPAVVVLSYVFNDIEAAAAGGPADLAPLHERWAETPHRQIPVLGRSWLLDDLVFRLREMRGASAYRDWMARVYREEGAVGRHLEELSRLARLVRERGSGLVVLVWPPAGPGTGGPVAEAAAEFLPRLEEALDPADVVELEPVLRAQSLESPEAYRAGPREGHPGPEAHAVAADVLNPLLRGALEGQPAVRNQ